MITCQVTGAGGGLEIQVPGEVPHQDGGASGTGGGWLPWFVPAKFAIIWLGGGSLGPGAGSALPVAPDADTPDPPPNAPVTAC